MDRNKKKTHYISIRLLTLLLVLSLCLLAGCQKKDTGSSDASAQTETGAQEISEPAEEGANTSGTAEDSGTDTDGDTDSTESGKTETVIIGIPVSLNESAEDELVRDFQITPSNGGRTVCLQIYRSESESYETVSTVETEDAETASFSFEFPQEYRQDTTTKWRITAEETETAAAYTSETFVLTTSNLAEYDITGEAACIYCVDTDSVLYDYNMNDRRSPASTAKVMSAIVTLESDIIDGECTVSQTAIDTYGSNLPFKVGQTFTTKSLLYAMILPSNNDAAAILAENVGGSMEEFADLMNQKALELGLADTHYENAHGLDADGQYTTAYELCQVMAYAYENETFRKIILTEKYTLKCTNDDDVKMKMVTTDMMLGTSDNFQGGKTGYTDDAKYCFVGVYTYHKKTYIVCTLGSGSDSYRWYDVKQLYKYIKAYA